MTRRHFLQQLSALGAARPVLAQPKRRLNFIFILADDLGWTDLSSYGSAFYETPGIDRLASQGVRFTNAYAACPVCSPTRASIMTGKYPARLGITNYLPGKHPTPYSKLIASDCLQQLPLEETTLAEALKVAGYVTGEFGKWHLGGPRFSPAHQGFDHVFSPARGASNYFYPGWREGDPPIEGKPGEYITDRLAEEAAALHSAEPGAAFLCIPHSLRAARSAPGQEGVHRQIHSQNPLRSTAQRSCLRRHDSEP